MDDATLTDTNGQKRYDTMLGVAVMLLNLSGFDSF